MLTVPSLVEGLVAGHISIGGCRELRRVVPSTALMAYVPRRGALELILPTRKKASPRVGEAFLLAHGRPLSPFEWPVNES